MLRMVYIRDPGFPSSDTGIIPYMASGVVDLCVYLASVFLSFEDIENPKPTDSFSNLYLQMYRAYVKGRGKNRRARNRKYVQHVR